jgi:hypothetical protein
MDDQVLITDSRRGEKEQPEADAKHTLMLRELAAAPL